MTALADVPDLFKVYVPKTSEDDPLWGEYVVYRSPGDEDGQWAFDLGGDADFTRLSLIIRPKGPAFEAEVGFEGNGRGPKWTARVSDPRLPFQVSLKGRTARGSAGASGSWPKHVGVTPLAGTLPQGGHYISPEPLASEMAMMAGASGVASSSGCKESEKKHYYAGVRKSFDDVIGVAAKIKTTLTYLDCEIENEKYQDASLAFTSATKYLSETSAIWAQTGYRRYRKDGGARIFEDRYCEINAGTTQATDYRLVVQAFPKQGVHDYRLTLTQATGKWEGYYDGTKWTEWTHDGWKNQSASRVEYNGEIHHKKTQMPGRDDYRCEFTECRYSTSTATDSNPAFVDGDLWSEAEGVYIAAEWGAQVEGTAPRDAVTIWDKKPPINKSNPQT